MSFDRRHFIRYQLPALLWAVIIFIISSVPGTRLPKLVHLVSDKFIHASVFFIFGLLVYRALSSPARVPPRFEWWRLLTALIIVILYGFSDEFHQGFVPGRTVDLKDALADTAGCLVSGLVILLTSKRKSEGPRP